MDNMKKLIIVIVILILILSIVILCLIQSTFREVDSVSGNEINYEDYQGEYVPENKVEKVTNKNRYYAVKQIINDYISYITNTEIGAEALNQILATDYKNEFGITKENITLNLSKFANSEIHIEDMYELELSESVSLIIINGKTKANNIGFNIIIKLDSLNQTFEIYPEEYLNKHGYNDIEKIAGINIISLNELTPKEYNTFSYKNVTNLEMCNYYLEDYIYNVTTNVENAYNLLDEEYRTTRFSSLNEYKSYINANLNKIQNMKLEEYTTVKYDDYKQYVCIDSDGNYYLFRETAIMEYTLLLDTYTVVLPEFVEKYNSATTQEKVALNISNFVQAINDKNYNYAYKVLNGTFKSNEFSTQSSFEAYVQNNLFSENSVEFEEYLVQNNTHVYKIQLKDANSDSSNKISITVIMELGSGTNFTMSFSIN